MASSHKSWVVEVAPKTATRSAVYRRAGCEEGFPGLDHTSTLYELFVNSVAKHAELPALGWRPVLVREGGSDASRAAVRAVYCIRVQRALRAASAVAHAALSSAHHAPASLPLINPSATQHRRKPHNPVRRHPWAVRVADLRRGGGRQRRHRLGARRPRPRARRQGRHLRRQRARVDGRDAGVAIGRQKPRLGHKGRMLFCVYAWRRRQVGRARPGALALPTDPRPATTPKQPMPTRPATACRTSACRCTTRWARAPSSS